MTKKVLTKMGESVIINFYDNGFMVEASGRDKEDDWTTTKTICPSLNEVVELITKYATMQRAD